MDKFTVVGFLDVMLKWVLIGPIENEIVSVAPLKLYALPMVFDRSWVVYQAGQAIEDEVIVGST
jgi:hypothetical protein